MSSQHLRAQRNAELGVNGSPPALGSQAYLESLPTGGLCRPGEVLVDEKGLSALRDEVGGDVSTDSPAPGSWRGTARVPRARDLDWVNARLADATGLQVATFSAKRRVEDVVEGVRSRLDDTGRVHANRVLTGEPVYQGGPGDEPRVSGEVDFHWPPDRPGDPADLAVLDTGIVANPALDAAVLPDPNDTDLLVVTGKRLATEAGHGTFICGLVRRVAPGLLIDPGQVLDPRGVGDDASLAAELTETKAPVVNLSLGCPLLGEGDLPALTPVLLSILDEGRVVVAAAGNHGSDERFFPACLPGVVAVGALDTTGQGGPVRAVFSNFGDWVSVWAPGVDLRSTYVRGTYPAEGGDRRFSGWASWSGTSFAAPLVAAEIARTYFETGKAAGLSPKDVWDQLRLSWPAVDPAVAPTGVVHVPQVDLTA